MPPPNCPFCDHSNPDGARFCNECGLPLHLQPSKRDATADGAPAENLNRYPLESAEANATVLAPTLLPSEREVDQTIIRGAMIQRREPESRSLSDGAAWLLAQARSGSRTTRGVGLAPEAEPRRKLWVAVGALALVALSVPAYYVYRQHAMEMESGLDAFPAPSGGGTNEGRNPTVTGTAVPQGTGLPATPQAGALLTPSQQGGSPVSTAELTDAAPASEVQPGAPAKARASATARHAAALPAVKSEFSERRPKLKQDPSKQDAPGRTVTKDSRTEMPRSSTLYVPPRTSDAGVRARRDAPAYGPCTEAVAALGLCDPSSKQGRD